jgi:hypothetical protein
MTTINKKREEILRLIAKVADGNDQSAQGAIARQLPQSTRSRLVRRRQSLAKTKEHRKQLEKRLRSGQLLELHQMLERRVAAIEGLLQRQQGPGPPLPGLLPGAAQGAQEVPGAPHDHAESTLSGAIREGLLADMLQMVSSNMMTGVFVVDSSGVEIRLFFREGEILHGEGVDVSGESAFFAAMAVEQGRFFFNETDELPDERTISSKTQFLILEALRQIDESKAQQGS